jgi:xanthine dehydrogenase accessory factor
MVVMPDGGFRGTIGGGALEWRALADARTLLAEDAPQARLRRQALGPELGQCCGGSVRLLIEVFDRTMAAEVAKPGRPRGRRRFRHERPPIARSREAGIQGGKGKESGSPLSRGRAEEQTGSALSRTILDKPRQHAAAGKDRPDGTMLRNLHPPDPAALSLRRRPCRPGARSGAGAAAVRGHLDRSAPRGLSRRHAGQCAAVHQPDPAAALAGAPADAFVLVMTHSHPLDLELVHAALAAGRFAYVGLIGSATKRARFRKRLKDLRLSAESVSRLVCPIGLAGITSKAPAAIAASVAADLLIRHEAVRECKEPVAPMAERA